MGSCCARRTSRAVPTAETEFRGGFAQINYLELPKALALTDQTPVYQRLATTDVPVMLA